MTAPVWVSTTTNKSGLSSAVGNRPLSVTAGDLLVALVHSKVDGTISITGVPSGWTLIRSGSIGTRVIHATYYKVAGASEPSTYTWTIGGVTAVGQNIVAISRITGADTLNPVNASAVQSNASSTSVTAPSVSPSVAECLLICTGGDDNGRTYTPTASMTERWEDRYNASYDISCSGATETLSASGATGTRVFTLNAPNANVAITIAIAPVASSGPTFVQLERGIRGLHRGIAGGF